MSDRESAKIPTGALYSLTSCEAWSGSAGVRLACWSSSSVFGSKKLVCSLIGLKTEPVETSTRMIVSRNLVVFSDMRSSILLFLRCECMNSGKVR